MGKRLQRTPELLKEVRDEIRWLRGEQRKATTATEAMIYERDIDRIRRVYRTLPLEKRP